MHSSPPVSALDPSSSTGSLRYSLASSNGSIEEQTSSYITADSLPNIPRAHPDPAASGCGRCQSDIDTLRATVTALDENINDSLNMLTDRINCLEAQLSDSIEELRAERNAGHESMRRTLSEVSRRLIGFIRQLFTTHPIFKLRRPPQSRTGMSREVRNTSVRE